MKNEKGKGKKRNGEKRKRKKRKEKTLLKLSEKMFDLEFFKTNS
jgi:hypothetical protein